MAELKIDLSDVEVGESSYTSLPAGSYPAMMVSGDYLPTKNGNGKCLHLTFRITEGEYAGRELRDFLTLEHPNEQTTKIAREKLKRLAVAVGAPNPDRVSTTEDLTGPLTIVVQQKEDSEWGDEAGLVNRISNFKKKSADTEPAAATAEAATAEDVPF